MNKEIKQVLKNQMKIMNTLANITNINADRDELYKCFNETDELLNPTKKEKEYEQSL